MAVGSGQDTGAAGAGPVVICCAAADEAAIQQVVPQLERDGHAVELVAGVERDPKLLAAAIDRCHGEGLYVLCRSAALGRNVVDALRDVLLAHHVPFGRTLTVPSTPTHELRERIATGLQKVASGRAQQMTRVPVEGRTGEPRRRTTQYGLPTPELARAAAGPPDPPRRPRRATQLGIPVGPPPPPRGGDDPPTVPLPSSIRAQLIDAGSDLDLPEETRQMRAPEAEALAAADAAAAIARGEKHRGVGPRAVSSPGGDEPLAEDSLGNLSLIKPEDLADLAHTGRFERVALSPNDVEIDDDEPAPGPALLGGGMGVGSAPTAPRPPPGTRDTLASPDPRRAPVPADAGGRAHEVAPATPSGFPAGIASPELAAGVRAPSSPGSTPTVRAAPVGIPGSDPDAPRPSMGMWVGVGIGVLALGIGGSLIAALWGDDEPENDSARASAQKADAAAQPTAADAAEAERDPTLAAEIEPPAPDAISPGQVRTQVMEALRSRKVRALDILLVAPVPDEAMLHAEAVAHCQGLSIEGLEGWRLPTIGELTSMTEAEMLGRGYYWSATAADTFGDTHWSWYGRRSRPVQRTDKSFVVCVRGQPVAG